jgi:hypothetical protein
MVNINYCPDASNLIIRTGAELSKHLSFKSRENA